jgi:hypothetical protein
VSDYTSVTNNPVYGPLRLVLVSLLTYAAGKGWIPADFVDPTFLAAAGTVVLAAWSFWEKQHATKKAELVTAVAVSQAVQAPETTSQAEQKAIVAGAKAIVAGASEQAITDVLNQSQRIGP